MSTICVPLTSSFEGGVQSAGSLGDGHFGHVRFKFFVKFDFDGHPVPGTLRWWNGGKYWLINYIHTYEVVKKCFVNLNLGSRFLFVW